MESEEANEIVEKFMGMVYTTDGGGVGWIGKPGSCPVRPCYTRSLDALIPVFKKYYGAEIDNWFVFECLIKWIKKYKIDPGLPIQEASAIAIADDIQGIKK